MICGYWRPPGRLSSSGEKARDAVSGMGEIEVRRVRTPAVSSAGNAPEVHHRIANASYDLYVLTLHPYA